MKPEHEALKAQFDEGLKKAKEADAAQQSAAEKNIRVMSMDQARNDMPWMRALAMEKELIAKQHLMSSVWIVTTYWLGMMKISPPVFLGRHS